MKIFYKFLLLCIMISSITTSIYSQPPIDDFNEQMKGFVGRVRVYVKCLRGKCTQEEQQIAGKAALKDGALLLVAVGALVGAGLILPKIVTWRFKKAIGENSIDFDREKISSAPRLRAMEGYWASSSDPNQDKYKGRFPFPKPNTNPWPGKEEFLDKLEKIEALAHAGSSRIEVIGYKGTAPSRLEQDKQLGSAEYFDRLARIGWTDAFGGYYVGQFNVKPSREFYRYVMNFKL